MFLLIILSVCFSYASSTERYYIPVTPGNCINCNFQNSQIENLDPNRNIFYFVFPEDFIEDKDYIIDIYKLKSYPKEHLIFSDSLYNKYHLLGKANVVVEHLESGLFKSFELSKIEKLPNYAFENFNDTLNFPPNTFPRSTKKIIVNNDKKFYVFNRLRKDRIGVVDLENRTSEILYLNEIIIKNNFKINFNNLDKYNQMKDVELIGKNRFDDNQVFGDTLFSVSNHTFMDGIASNGDTIGRGFIMMNVFVKDQYLTSYPIQILLMDTCYFTSTNFHFYNDKFYFVLLKNDANCHLNDTNKYFIGEFVLRNNKIVFNKILNFQLPEINYDVGYRLIHGFFYNQYFVTELSNNLYNLENQSIVKLKIPHNVKLETKALFEVIDGTIINTDNFVIKDNCLYMIIFEKYKQEYRWLKYNILHSKLERNILVPIGHLAPILDVQNPEIIYLPLNDHQLVKKNMK